MHCQISISKNERFGLDDRVFGGGVGPQGCRAGETPRCITVFPENGVTTYSDATYVFASTHRPYRLPKTRNYRNTRTNMNIAFTPYYPPFALHI